MDNVTRQRIDEMVAGCLRHFCQGTAEIRGADSLQDDLGIDSIEMVELAAMLTQQCGMGSRRIDLDGVDTVGDLGELLERSLSPGRTERP